MEASHFRARHKALKQETVGDNNKNKLVGGVKRWSRVFVEGDFIDLMVQTIKLKIRQCVSLDQYKAV